MGIVDDARGAKTALIITKILPPRNNPAIGAKCGYFHKSGAIAGNHAGFTVAYIQFHFINSISQRGPHLIRNRPAAPQQVFEEISSRHREYG